MIQEWLLFFLLLFVTALAWMLIARMNSVGKTLAALSNAWPKLTGAHIIALYALVIGNPRRPNAPPIHSTNDLLLEIIEHLTPASSAKRAQVLAFLSDIPK